MAGKDTGFVDDVTHVDESDYDMLIPSGAARFAPTTVSSRHRHAPEPPVAGVVDPPPAASVCVDEDISVPLTRSSAIRFERQADPAGQDAARLPGKRVKTLGGPRWQPSRLSFTPQLDAIGGPCRQAADTVRKPVYTLDESPEPHATTDSLQQEIKMLQSKIQAMSASKRTEWRASVNDSLHVKPETRPSRDTRTVTSSVGEGEENGRKVPPSQNAARNLREIPARVVRNPVLDRIAEDADSAIPGPMGGLGSGGGETRGLVQSGTSESVTSGPGKQSSVWRKPIKLIQYDGVKVPFETFMAKLRNAELHNGWNEAEKCAFLRDALIDDAGQILWELSPEASSDEIIEQLRTRFGNANNAERYRAELSSRRRGVGESTQSVYTDIRRLLSLAFPKQKGEMYEAIGKDYFLTALDDSALRIRVLDRQPKTLDETYSLVVQMEACSKAMAPNPSVESTSEGERKKVRLVSPARESEAERRIKALEEIIEQQRQEIRQVKQQSAKLAASKNNRGSQFNKVSDRAKSNANASLSDQSQQAYTVYVPVPSVGQPMQNGYMHVGQFGSGPGTPAVPPEGQQGGSNPSAATPQLAQGTWNVGQQGAVFPPQQYYGRGYRGGYRRGGPGGRRWYAYSQLPREMCARCHEMGHWKRECPQVGYRPNFGTHSDVGNVEDQPNPQVQVPIQGRVNMFPSGSSSAVYIDLKFKDHTKQAMLDSGCEVCLCPLRMCKNAKIIPVKTELMAANGTRISVVGLTRMFFTIGGVRFQADMYVSDDISEMILGMNFLCKHECEWLFAKNRIVISGISVPLRTCPSQLSVRRIYVRESVVIPPDTAANVPVKLPVANLRTPKNDWLSQAKQVRPGLLVARVLLPHSSEYTSLAFLNVSGKNQALRSGFPLGKAIACPTESVRPLEEAETDELETNVCGDNFRCDCNVGVDAVDSVVDRVINSDSEYEEAVESLDEQRDAAAGGASVLNQAACSVDDTECTAREFQSARCGSDDTGGQRSSAGGELAAQSPPVSACVSMAGTGVTAAAHCQGESRVASDSRQPPGEFLESGHEGVCPGATVVAGPIGSGSRPCLAGPAEPSLAGQVNSYGLTECVDLMDPSIDSFSESVVEQVVANLDLNVLAPSFTPNGVNHNPLLSEADDCTMEDTHVVDFETKVKCASVVAGSDSSLVDDFAHVQPVIDKLPDILTDEQRQQAIELIKRNSDIFSKHDFDVGCTDLLTASINTGDHAPIAEPLRRHARVHLDVIDETIDKMVDAGIVESCCSEWAANLVVVPKRDEHGKPTTPRITIDFRKLNAVTYKDKYPIPNTKDCLQSLTNVQWLSSIDLSNSFFQVKIRPQDRDKTAFITRKGQFRLTRLAMGCCNSPSVFSRLMAMVIGGLKCCLAFIDDTIVFSSSFEQHLKDLQSLFDRFRWAKLKLRPAKCRLFQTECEFLGHRVGPDGIAVQDRKVACIQAWPFPENITELRAFLGICSYYRSYVRGFAAIAEPLTQCLRRDIPLERTPERQEAFERLKMALMNAPILAVPRNDPECVFVVDSDASSHTAGAVLQQYQDGKLRVVEYASRVFNSAERNYCATRRELAAVIFALKTFRPYILGTKFQLRVDNQAVSFLMRVKNPAGQAARYLDFLADFEFQLIYRKGSSNANADALSRMPPCGEDRGEPCEQCQRRVIGKHKVSVVQTRARSRQTEREEPTPADEPSVSSSTTTAASESENESRDNIGNSQPRKRRRGKKALLQEIAPKAWEQNALGWTEEIMRKAQLSDQNIGPAIQWVESKTRPPWSVVDGQAPMLRALWRQYESLTIENGVLYRNFYDTSGEIMHKQFVLPHEFRVSFLELIHNDVAGHLKMAKCVPHIMRRAWWYGWKTDLDTFIRCCQKCESFCRRKPPRQAHLKATHAGAPGEKVAIDLQGPFPASNGYKFVLTIICMFSKYGVCVPLRNKEAHTVAKALVDHFFLKFGLCQVLLSDLGKEFENELMSALTQSLGITKIRTTSYRPQSNAICEVFHRVLNTMFAKCVRQDQKDWSEWLPYINFCYNAAEHSSTKFPPFYVFFGRMPIWTIDLSLPYTEGDRSVPEYVADVTAKLQKAHALVRTNLTTAWNASSRWYNRKVKPKSFQEGETVRVYYPRKFAGRTPKWQSFFGNEAVIAKKINDATYLVTSRKWREGKIVHVDKLKAVKQFE